MKSNLLFSIIAMTGGLCPSIMAADGDVTISGETMQWHKVILTLDGPAASATDVDNPFLNRRFNVTFTSPTGKTFNVPGYFAGDGNGGGTGSKWVAHLNPDAIGNWTYLISFRTGADVAVALTETEGTAVAQYNGKTGGFTVAASTKSGADFRAPDKGMLVNRGHHYLTFANGQPFIHAGLGICENLLGYTGFTNTNKTVCPTGVFHNFTVHAADWQAGDPDWDNGKGKALIGMFNYIANEGANNIYFQTNTLNDDGKDTFPHLEPTSGTYLGEPTSPAEWAKLLRYDLLKLKQWDIAFAHAQKKGIFFNWHFQEHNNLYFYGGSSTKDVMTVHRRLLFRMLNAYFGYYNGIMWNLGEECQWTLSQMKAQMAYIKAIDPYDHPVTIQLGGAGQSVSWMKDFMGYANNDVFSTQETLSPTAAFTAVQQRRNDSRASGVPVCVTNEEPQKIENNNLDTVGYPYGRREKMWPWMMSGGNAFQWYIQKDGGGHGLDQVIEDFSVMKNAFNWSRYMRDFLYRLPLLNGQSSMTLVTSTTGDDFTLYKDGEIYGIYNTKSGTGMSLDLTGKTGSYTVKWYDPRNGGALQNGTVTTIAGGAKRDLGSAPNNTNMDWAILVQNTASVTNQAPVVNAGSNLAVTLPATAALDGSVSDDGLPELVTVTTVWTKISGPGTVSFGNAAAIDTTASFSKAGTYVLRLTASDTQFSPFDEVQVVVAAAGTNTAPVVSAGTDQSITLPTTVALDGTVSDDGLPALATLTTTWTKLSGPGTVSFGNAAAIDTTASFSVAGTYVLRLTADDSAASTFDDVQVVVAAAPAGPTVTDFTLIDADTDLPVPNREHLVGNVILSLADLPANLALRANTAGTVGSIKFGVDGNANFKTESTAPYSIFGDTAGNYAPWTLAIGSHTITGTPYSGAGATGTAGSVTTLSLTLLAANKAPVVSAGSDLAITLPATAVLNGTVSDDGLPTGSSLTIEWSVLSGPGTGTVSFGDPSAIDTTASFSMAGTYVLQVMAYDDDLATFDNMQVVVTATGINKPGIPTVTGDGTATPTMHGAADAGNVIHILVDGVEVGTTTAGADNTWSYTISGLTAGTHAVTVKVENTSGTSPVSDAKVISIAAASDGTVASEDGGGGGRCGFGGLSSFVMLALFAFMRCMQRLRADGE